MSTFSIYLLISFAVYKWKTGRWNKCRLHHRQIQHYCSHITKISSISFSSSATTDNSLLAAEHDEDEKLNPNPLLIGYKVRKVYCTSTSISKAQKEHVGGKSQDTLGSSDIDKTFYINQEDKGGNKTTKVVFSKRQKFGKKRQYNMSDPMLTSSSVVTTSNKFCDKQIRPHSRTVCTTHCSNSRNTTSRYHLSSRDKKDTISQTRTKNVVEINARIMNLCQVFEWSEWSTCNLLSRRRDDSNYINYTPNDLFPDTSKPKCDKKVAGVQYRKRQKINLDTKQLQKHFLYQKCLSEFEERTCLVNKCNRKGKKGDGRYKSYNIANWNFTTKDHKKRSSSDNKNNAVWSRPRLLMTNLFGQKKNRIRKPFQRKRKNVSHSILPLQLPLATKFHQTIPIPILPEPEKLTSTFTPFLHVGPWSSCRKNENNNNKRLNQYENKRSFNNVTSAKVVSNENPIFRNIMSKKHNRRKMGETKEETKQRRGKREDGLFIGLQKIKSRNSWAPKLPSDLEISSVATSVPDPHTGLQRRTVECRGQDGERLPFR